MRKRQPSRRPGSRISNGTLAALSIILLFILAGLAYTFWPAPDLPEQTKPATAAGSASSFATGQVTTKTPVTSNNTTYTTTSAATTTSRQKLSQAERQAALEQAAQAVAARLDQAAPGRYGVYFHNLIGNESWGHQEKEPFVAASSIKLGITSYLYEQIASGQVSPDEILKYDNRPYPTGDYEAGTGTIQGLPNGSSFTVSETAGLAIRISDNCATNMIIRRLGGIDQINPWLRNISGIVDYREKVSYLNYGGQAQSGRHRTCAQDLGLHAVHLYELAQKQPAVYDELLEYLTSTEFDFGIHKGIPSEIKVAHKIGTNGAYSTENDVGIIFSNEPFVLCVTTETASAAAAHQIQADIAAIFYEAVAGWPWE